MARSRRIIQSSQHQMALIPQMKTFVCKYPELGNDWKSCSTRENRHCWLKSSDGHNFSIHTDYETMYPPGVLREYWLVVDNKTINGDGIDNPYGKVFNQTYPGPWIKACWGDLIRVHVTNKLRYNGTTVHWHGIKQNGTMEMDGVNGVTQRPIAPLPPMIPLHMSFAPFSIGIGQRYHVVLHAKPRNDTKFPASENGNYWIRTVAADGCKGFEDGNEPDERQGILRYEPVSTEVPQTWRDNWTKDCTDEKYENLQPILPWSIPPVKLDERDRSKDLELGIEKVKDRPHAGDKFSWWAFGERPLWLDFSKPTITLLEETKEWPDDYVIVPAENRDGWVYLVITAPSLDRIGTNKTFKSLAHPLHLHGHDFALLAQGTNSSQINDPNNLVTLKFDNPPRRDVALIPAGGYLIVAFKADNPGSWLFHCHIAWHASSGLALQIMEREEDLRRMMTPEKLKQANDGCEKWKDWYDDRKNHWNPVGVFQDDSGV
ncbi:laccase 2 [Fusarium circinatum]|uniref:Laccase 2 n=1 Tax=Fusarium circinatum TaxID=48490 RepID=A0A8H5XA74_FUSCI|nr:laccase 2 [Fusarium circinatum]